ncbi:MAG: DUF1015 domain-containing protein [Clostridia bacterium]|nr:DUF1015 domain-containing protein [Clostridia bacterium]
MMNKRFFRPADIILPKKVTSSWPVIACDQFTSDPDYWRRLDGLVGDEPSTLRLILPEAFLSEAGERIPVIRETMAEYLGSDFFATYPDAMIFVERTLPSGKVRRGVVGAVDLGEYPDGLLRPTEETVPERVPPRAAIRRGAPVDLPHIMLFTNSTRAVPDEVTGPVVYDVDLPGGGGHVRGSLMSDGAKARFTAEIAPDENGVSLIVGDGNHSLAAAKSAGVSYALAEVVSLNDEAIVFEPIYRVVKNVRYDALLSLIPKGGDGNAVSLICGDRREEFYSPGLPVSFVDSILSEYLRICPESSVDYIHGLDELISLASDGKNAGFVFGGIDKKSLFPWVSEHGVLPRKAFSMGSAFEKRYYMELMRSR